VVADGGSESEAVMTEPNNCGRALSGGPDALIRPALRSVEITQGHYFFNAAPYILTLLIMIGSLEGL
jgi:hypothetical protein